MNATNVNTEINLGLGWSIVLSVLMMVAGIVTILVPAETGIAVPRAVGWLLVFSGATHLAYAWHTRGGGGLWWGLLLGLLYLIAGGYILLHPEANLASLMLVLTAYLVVESLIEFILSNQLRPFLGSSWVRFDGIITLILAMMLAFGIRTLWPVSYPRVIEVLVGISMLFSGLARLMVSVAPRRVAGPPHGEFHD